MEFCRSKESSYELDLMQLQAPIRRLGIQNKSLIHSKFIFMIQDEFEINDLL